MKLPIYKKAKNALKNSLRHELVDPVLVKEQFSLFSQEKISDRLAVMKLYRRLLEKRLNQEIIYVQTPLEVDNTLKVSLEKVINTKIGKFTLRYEQVPGLIGGLRLKHADTTLDYSILGKLEVLKEALN